ncbi:uncharacterized protein EDB91DRAFT_1018518, partial [Suillus paluster]|uniref:uncharacterized protein n=1 Tax=Suillus paluster TaxID=48578 RepID=UPI001B8697A1
YISSLKWTRNQLFLRSRMLQQNRRVNSWNAFVSLQFYDGVKITITFLGLGRGDRFKLTAFIAQNKARLLRDYGRLTVTEKKGYNIRVLEAREAKNHTARANPKAVKHDVNAAFTSMDREVCFHLVIRLGMSFPSTLYPTNYSKDERVSLNRARPLNKLIGECRELIQAELDFILMEKNVSSKVKMNYTNYERAIVEHYGIEL